MNWWASHRFTRPPCGGHPRKFGHVGPHFLLRALMRWLQQCIVRQFSTFFTPQTSANVIQCLSLSLPVPMYGSPFFWSILGWNRNGFGGPISYQTRGNNFSQIVEFPLCSWNFCHGLKEAWGKNKLEQTTKIVRFLRFPSTVFTIK